MPESPLRLAIIASAFALALMSCASESGPEWAPAESVDQTPSHLGGIDMAMDANGDAIAVWASRWAGEPGLSSSDYTVWAQRFSEETGWGSPTKLGSTGLRGAGEEPVIAMSSRGDAVAAWYEWASDGDDQTGEGVWAARFDPETGWEDATLVGEAGRHPRVAINDDGQAVMMWTRSFDSVWVRHLDPEVGWGAASRLDRGCVPREDPDTWNSLTNASAAKNPNVAINDSGRAIAIWYDNENESSELGFCDGTLSLRASEYVPGAGWNAPTTIGVPSTAFGFLHAALALDDRGRALAGSLAGEVSRYNTSEGWGALDLGFDDGYGRSSVALAKGGKAIVVWEAVSDVPIFPEAVWAVRFSPETGWSRPAIVSTPRDYSTEAIPAPKSPTALDSSGVDAAVNDAGECVVVWHEVGNPTARPPPFSVWGNSYAPGRGWGAPTVLSAGETIDAAFPRIALDARGRAMALWIEVQRDADFPRPSRLMWSRLE